MKFTIHSIWIANTGDKYQVTNPLDKSAFIAQNLNEKDVTLTFDTKGRWIYGISVNSIYLTKKINKTDNPEYFI